MPAPAMIIAPPRTVLIAIDSDLSRVRWRPGRVSKTLVGRRMMLPDDIKQAL
jgi:hypothetical protein